MENKINIEDDKVYDNELQKTVNRVAHKYKDCDGEFNVIGEEPKSGCNEKDIPNKTRVSDEEIVNILSKM